MAGWFEPRGLALVEPGTHVTGFLLILKEAVPLIILPSVGVCVCVCVPVCLLGDPGIGIGFPFGFPLNPPNKGIQEGTSIWKLLLLQINMSPD